MNNRVSAFDFPLYFTLLAMSNDANFDMANLDHAGLAGADPFHAVTFVENHDTESRRDLVPKNIQPEDKPLAYAYILTSEGLPCVFYKDYSNDAGCLGGRLQNVIVNLMWIHQNIAQGATVQRWKDGGVFAYERLGGPHLLVGLNKDKQASRTIHAQTGFPAGSLLHEYAGHGPDLHVAADGSVTLNLPRNANGLGYVCYSTAGISDGFAAQSYPAIQVFEGAQDLDIKPAESGVSIQVFRIWVDSGKQVSTILTFDTTGWDPSTTLILTAMGPAGAVQATKTFAIDASGETMTFLAGVQGWYSFKILLQGARAELRSSYKLSTSYQAPAKLA